MKLVEVNEVQRLARRLEDINTVKRRAAKEGYINYKILVKTDEDGWWELSKFDLSSLIFKYALKRAEADTIQRLNELGVEVDNA